MREFDRQAPYTSASWCATLLEHTASQKHFTLSANHPHGLASDRFYDYYLTFRFGVPCFYGCYQRTEKIKRTIKIALG